MPELSNLGDDLQVVALRRDHATFRAGDAVDPVAVPNPGPEGELQVADVAWRR
jgi:hypothetical protein